ncbi:Reverse transcriptase [Camponotus japonicus]
MMNRMNQSIRAICNRVIGGYRTVSLEAASLLARIPPVFLQAECRRRVYERVKDLRSAGNYSTSDANAIKEEEKLLLIRQWQLQLEHATYGTRTVSAVLRGMILTGHGVFSTFLERIQRAPTSLCLSCNLGIVDSPEHTVVHCTRWADERKALTDTVGLDLSLENLIKKMLESKENWRAVLEFSKKVMLCKENEERARQARRSRSRSLSVRTSTDTN